MKKTKSKTGGFRFGWLVGYEICCIILSVLLLPGISPAFKGGIPVCLDQLHHCKEDLVECSSDIKKCMANWKRCTEKLNRCTTDLGGCTADLNKCKSDLGSCRNDLMETQADLTEALGNLAVCQAELEEFKKRPPAPVPMTGQNPDLFFFYPTPAGSDGNLQKGAAWPNPRFTDNGDGTITDNLTGLFWLKNTKCTAFSPEDRYGQNNRDWFAALRAVNLLASGNCGLKDGSLPGQWRLPNLRELLSLVHYGFADPALPNTAGTQKWEEGVPFAGVQTDYFYSFWSSSSQASPDFRSQETAWGVDFFFGGMNIYSKFNQIRIWPVRSRN